MKIVDNRSDSTMRFSDLCYGDAFSWAGGNGAVYIKTDDEYAFNASTNVLFSNFHDREVTLLNAELHIMDWQKENEK